MMNFYEQVDANKKKSFFVIVGFYVFIIASAFLMVRVFGASPGFLGVALIFSGIMSFASYYYSDRIILGISGAKPATRDKHFNFYTVAENLSMAAGLPLPKLYVLEDTALNAFATGRDPEHAVVCATTGLLEKLDRTELEGVIAHELAHIKNYDIRLMSIVTILVGFIALLADIMLRASFLGGSKREGNNSQLGAIFTIIGFALVLLSPIIAQLIQLAISRRREFLADASGAAITKYPEGLARALEKIAGDREPLEAANKATAHLYISNPLKNHHDAIGMFAKLFSTHPPVTERIKALRGGLDGSR